MATGDPGTGSSGREKANLQEVAYCRECDVVARAYTGKSLPGVCTKCKRSWNVWSLPSSQEAIVVRLKDASIKMLLSYMEVRRALLGGILTGDDEFCAIQSVYPPLQPKMEERLVVTQVAPLDGETPAGSSDFRLPDVKWKPLRESDTHRESFQVEVLFKPVKAHGNAAATVGGIIGAVIGMLWAPIWLWTESDFGWSYEFGSSLSHVTGGIMITLLAAALGALAGVLVLGLPAYALGSLVGYLRKSRLPRLP